jgi:hypothetical protein
MANLCMLGKIHVPRKAVLKMIAERCIRIHTSELILKLNLDGYSIHFIQSFLILCSMMNTNILVSCPECKQSIELNSDLIVGQHATCPSCNTELVVTWLFPICLDYQETKEPVPNCQDMHLD